MNKQEALQKIKELQEYIEECEKKPELSKGQLYQHKSGELYIAHSSGGFLSDSKVTLVCEDGRSWAGDEGFSGDEDKFTYLGMASDLLTVKT